MRKLDQRGVAAFEFCLVLIPFLVSMLVIFELGRYAITMQSLRAYAGAGAREVMIKSCYVEPVLKKQMPDCSTADLTDVDKTKISPFLGGAELSLTTRTATSSDGTVAPVALIVTATYPNSCASSKTSDTLPPRSFFCGALTDPTTLLWHEALDDPSASTQIPF